MRKMFTKEQIEEIAENLTSHGYAVDFSSSGGNFVYITDRADLTSYADIGADLRDKGYTTQGTACKILIANIGKNSSDKFEIIEGVYNSSETYNNVYVVHRTYTLTATEGGNVIVTSSVTSNATSGYRIYRLW